MAEPRTSPAPRSALPQPNLTSRFLGLLLLIFVPVVLAAILFQPPDFDPAPLPSDHSFADSLAVPERHDHVLEASERIGEGLLPGPEDLAYDAEKGYLYTGCSDGWIRRVGLKDGELKVEDWAYVGGRPLGLALGPGGSLVVAESYKGLLLVKPDQTIELMTNEAEGLKFGLTDGVDVASDGSIYFTDASYKYNFERHMLDIFEGRPHRRLMSFNPSTNQTIVLAHDLYFANGVAVSPDQCSLIFCETRCHDIIFKYKNSNCGDENIINRTFFLVVLNELCYYCYCIFRNVEEGAKDIIFKGTKKGMTENFIENLPGYPDNIRCDGEGNYWIALSSGRTISWDILFKFSFVRKMATILEKFVKPTRLFQDSGILRVTLQGQPLTIYSDRHLILVTCGIKVGKDLYYGSLYAPYVSKIDLSQY